MTRIAVVGGGITGLAAAWEAMRSGAEVTLIEASDRLGGKIRTQEIAGHRVDMGPDAFLARVSDAVDLCRELGIEDELVSPATDQAAIWTEGMLRPLPRGIVLGVPTELRSLARSRIISRGGVARAGLDLVMPRRGRRRRNGYDVSVAELVSARLGRQVTERLVDPLLSGIHAGPSERLSAQATVPQLADVAARRRSLLRALRPYRRAAAPPGEGNNMPLFHSLKGGLGQLVTTLGRELERGGVTIELGAPVDSVPLPGADATVMAVPAPAAADLLQPVSPDAAAELGAIDHASVVMAVLFYTEEAFPEPLTGSGFLVPRETGRLMTACSFASNKWPHWAPPGEVVLRVSAGRWGDRRAFDMTDVEVVERLHNELVGVLSLRDAPRRARIVRWADSFPQYRVGHLHRVEQIEALLARDVPTVVATGATFRGIGIPACISQGRAAARQALAVAEAPRTTSGVRIVRAETGGGDLADGGDVEDGDDWAGGGDWASGDDTQAVETIEDLEPEEPAPTETPRGSAWSAGRQSPGPGGAAPPGGP